MSRTVTHSASWMATAIAALCVWCLITTVLATNETRNDQFVMDGGKGFAVYEVLGFLDEYYGRLTLDGDDVIERFYPSERATSERFGRLLDRVRNEQGMTETI